MGEPRRLKPRLVSLGHVVRRMNGSPALLVAFDVKRCEVEFNGRRAAGGDPVAFEIVRVAEATHSRDGDHILPPHAFSKGGALYCTLTTLRTAGR